MDSFQQHYGHWVIAAFMIVIASWIFYRYLAPRTWREWSRAGIVQAFIIALYAEMYGFPLTIYLLTDFLGVDLPLSGYSGHLWATLFGYGPIGATIEMVLGYALLVAGVILIIRGWREVYRARREKRLATGGVYAMMRHPQYTGIMLALFGEGVVHWPTLLTLALFPVMVLLYALLARREEKEMLGMFGDEYRAHQRPRADVSAALGRMGPAFSNRRNNPEGKSLPTARKELQNKITVLLGGRASEHLVFGHLSSSVQPGPRKTEHAAFYFSHPRFDAPKPAANEQQK